MFRLLMFADDRVLSVTELFLQENEEEDWNLSQVLTQNFHPNSALGQTKGFFFYRVSTLISEVLEQENQNL